MINQTISAIALLAVAGSPPRTVDATRFPMIPAEILGPKLMDVPITPMSQCFQSTSISPVEIIRIVIPANYSPSDASRRIGYAAPAMNGDENAADANALSGDPTPSSNSPFYLDLTGIAANNDQKFAQIRVILQPGGSISNPVPAYAFFKGKGIKGVASADATGSSMFCGANIVSYAKTSVAIFYVYLQKINSNVPSGQVGSFAFGMSPIINGTPSDTSIFIDPKVKNGGGGDQ